MNLISAIVVDPMRDEDEPFTVIRLGGFHVAYKLLGGRRQWGKGKWEEYLERKKKKSIPPFYTMDRICFLN